jgi:acetylornithine deacetylase
VTGEPVSEAERAVIELIGVEEVTSLAAGLVVEPGENPPGEEAATVAVLAEACRLRGIDPVLDDVAPGRPNMRGVLPGGDGPGLMFLGHSDVVPAGDGWTTSPIGGLVRDGRLYGRGAADMKGGLAAFVVAMGALRRAGIELSGSVELAVTVDEEDAALGVQHYLKTGDRSNFVGCVVAEPTSLQTIIAARGDAYLTLDVTGQAAHSGNPDDGANAIYGATRAIDDLRRWHDELERHSHPLAGPATVSVGWIGGGTGPSVVAGDCRVIADRRLLPSEDGDQALDQLRTRLDRLDLTADGLKIETGLTLDMPGFETSPDATIVGNVVAATAAIGGPQLEPGGWTAACDGGFIAHDTGVPVVVFGPGSVAEQAHHADESVELEELVLASRAYALTAMRTLARS